MEDRGNERDLMGVDLDIGIETVKEQSDFGQFPYTTSSESGLYARL